MTHEQIRQLSQDSKFLKILEVSITKTASAVMLEDPSAYQAGGPVKRHSEAERVINNLQDERKKFTILIANTNEVNSLITIENDSFIWPPDMTNLNAAFDGACSANFNIVAGLTNLEMP